MFLTCNNSKGSILKQTLQVYRFDNVSFIDDRIDHIKDLQKFCTNANINYNGKVFTRVIQPKQLMDEEIAEFQIKNLLKNGIWYEDEQAKKIINNLLI